MHASLAHAEIQPQGGRWSGLQSKDNGMDLEWAKISLRGLMSKCKNIADTLEWGLGVERGGGTLSIPPCIGHCGFQTKALI